MSDPIFDTVQRIFDRYDVPASVWYPIMQAESGGNPNAIGDNGDSIGLFQINTRSGQGIAYANNKNALMDPALNASVAAPAIWSAYQSITGQYSVEHMAAQVARRSGHPGGSPSNPFNENDPRIQRIDEIAIKYLQGATPGADQTSPVKRALADNGIMGAQDALSKIAGVLSDAENWLTSIDLRAIGISILGIIVLIIAIVTMDHGNIPNAANG